MVEHFCALPEQYSVWHNLVAEFERNLGQEHDDGPKGPYYETGILDHSFNVVFLYSDRVLLNY